MLNLLVIHQFHMMMISLHLMANVLLMDLLTVNQIHTLILSPLDYASATSTNASVPVPLTSYIYFSKLYIAVYVAT